MLIIEMFRLNCTLFLFLICRFLVDFGLMNIVILFLLFFSDVLPIVRHADFRLFACMNPATDVGKKDLPLGIRNRYQSSTLCVYCLLEYKHKLLQFVSLPLTFVFCSIIQCCMGFITLQQ